MWRAHGTTPPFPLPEIFFASPGGPNTLTGGYLYNQRVREGLRARGWTVHNVRLSGAFPFPAMDDLVETAHLLAQPGENAVIVIDGLALGAFNDAVLKAVRAKIVALVHHPLAEETGLEPTQVSVLFESERHALRSAVGVIVSSPHTRQS
ncbi:MAG: glycosyltransferase family 4 protein, partial [Methyloligellaceae bacterium]